MPLGLVDAAAGNIALLFAGLVSSPSERWHSQALKTKLKHVSVSVSESVSGSVSVSVSGRVD